MNERSKLKIAHVLDVFPVCLRQMYVGFMMYDQGSPASLGQRALITAEL